MGVAPTVEFVAAFWVAGGAVPWLVFEPSAATVGGCDDPATARTAKTDPCRDHTQRPRAVPPTGGR